VRLSVVMAVRNGSAYLGDAVESVLAQSVTDFEFLIVDDASDDDTPGILIEYQRLDSRVCVLRNDRTVGPGPSANRALVQARGSFVARHDADDISPPGRFATQLEALESDADISLVTGAIEFFGDGRYANGVRLPPLRQPRLEWDLLFTNAIGAGGHVMFPRVVRGSPVLFPVKYRYAEDYALWCRLSRLGRIVCPAQVIYRYRQHPSSITSRETAQLDGCLAMIRHEYQTQYLRSQVSPDVTAEVARFWNGDGGHPVGVSFRRAAAISSELRSNFLAYIEQRYGPSDRADLEADIDIELRGRLAHWLFRSIRFVDAKSCFDILAIASAKRMGANVSGDALRLALVAFLRRFGLL
jgi:Glycosyl transferase family 2